ncbi:hypothetical protein T310_6164 [Rasamsonia emersonii CBS 393.64]|uniref:HRQ family protein n=1 Tax=Rasamsonia emersonii (strain ATCC 16479 / CBS 393.64 / IMI 116815) TaxID=1408163 RepID=A0A0F4YP26_RASE3|nr:hypothetical protein T310_6164 [Rasamsonia emersonii CBS 393.64]KKA19840.1 hypothetical protein T310_6164 [Rasamsonia emersonii CBS 393.64]
MDFLNVLDPKWVIGLFLLVTTATCLAVNKSQRDALVRNVRFRGRKSSTARTQPPSISPEKSATGSPSIYSDVLPPPRREALTRIEGKRPRTAAQEVNEKKIREHILPMTADYRTADGDRYTPTGFSVHEIKELGNFPDYATLSGVPLPNPYYEFDIDKARPRPYRPFRWAYHQTMSLKKMETDWWIELENTYRERIAQRKGLYAKHGNAVLSYLPGSELACKEMMEMVLQFICARYPKYFSLTDNRILTNRILGTEQDIRSKHPLEILMDNVPEDFAIMMRDDKTGYYFFRAGVICSSLGWNVGMKIGLPLHEIHKPIPDYKEKMQFSMDRFFVKMPADKPIQRGSWGLEVEQPLYMPPGDPHELHRLSQNPNLRLTDCYLRVDWQTLRRLPLSAGVVFNFKALFTPVTEFRDEPKVPALLAKILKEGKRNLMEYKNTWHVEHVVLPKLEEWAKEQEDKGVVEKNWEVSTLEEDPWFRGWEEKWHGQQGY